MYLLDDLKFNRLYKKQFILPFRKEDKRHGSAILLLTPNYEISKELLNSPFTLDRQKLYTGYYIERDIMYTINHESRALEIDYPEYDSNGVVLEGGESFRETTDVSELFCNLEDCSINDLYCQLGDRVIFFNEMYDENYLKEAQTYNLRYRQLLYNDRLRNNKSVMPLYDRVKADFPWISRTFINYMRYKKFNIFIDLYYYNQAYLANNSFNILKSVDMYFEFVRRFLNDRRITDAGYEKKTVFIPVYGWDIAENSKIFDFKKNLNPISVFYKRIRFNQDELKAAFPDLTFVFFGKNAYFKFDTQHIDAQTYLRFMKFTQMLYRNDPVPDSEVEKDEDNSSGAIAADIIGDIERSTGTIIDNISSRKNNESSNKGSGKKVTAATNVSIDAKDLLVKKINDIAALSKTKDDALDKLETDKDIRRIINDLQSENDSGVNISAARANRITAAQDAFMQKQLDGKSIRDLIDKANKPKELPESSIPIETINDEWHHMKAVNFEKEYDLDADIVSLLNSLSDRNKSYPISILDIKKVDTSTSEDSVYTYTVSCEGYDGQRFTFHFDIPKFRNNRFMRLRGNEKIFSIEMPLIPISKTSGSKVQIVSLYNKAFVDAYNTSSGRSNPYANRLIKAFNKMPNNKEFSVTRGDNSRICEKYELPIDYVDLARTYNKITFHSPSLKQDVTLYFNQDEIRKIPGVNSKNGIPIAISSGGKCLYYNEKANTTMAQFITSIIDLPKFKEVYAGQPALKRGTYSMVWVLNTYIPTMVILAHDLGLIKALDMAGIIYNIASKPNNDPEYDYIQLKDGYINYKNNYSSMMLMNGLRDCNMEQMEISDLNKKTTWIDQLDLFGGRSKSDGLDNFKDLMYDPVTVSVSKDYGLPDTWHGALIYASNMLADNKFTKHTDISTNRYRTNEIVAAQFYRVLAQSYREYSGSHKHGRKKAFSMKQSAVIDLILQQNNTSDLSIFQPLSEIETKNTVSTKGVTGLNSERAYTLEKRGYNKSMINVIAQSTGFASTVGVNRITTIDPNISANRGYFKSSDIEEKCTVTNSMGMTEALTPFMLTSDDPFRALMCHVQTAKHGTPIDKGVPQLVTTGADAAMPYLSSDMFAFKAKRNGKVIEFTDDYMKIEYDDGTLDFIVLEEQVKKNSDGGFYIILQLKTDKKLGDKFKANEILAWDKKSYSKIGGLKQLSYNLGCLCKVAIMSSEDGYEDSGICSEWFTEAMASDIVVMKSLSLPANTNVLKIAKKGDPIREGDPVFIFQNAFDDADATALLKNLNIDDGDITTIGRNIVKAKVTGVISDIKVYRTCELSEMSDSMRRLFESVERRSRAIANAASDTVSDVKYNMPRKLPATGKLKNLDKGVLIEIYMRYHDKLSAGDKSTSNANKQVYYGVYKDSEAPYTDFRPTEKIDNISSASSTDGRIITSIFKIGALNKLLIELQRKCCEMYGKPWMTLHEAVDFYTK